jgi:hypothetical protein
MVSIVNKYLMALSSTIIILVPICLTTITSSNKYAYQYLQEEAMNEGAEASGYVKYMHDKNVDPISGNFNFEAMAQSKAELAKYRANKKSTRAFPAMSFVDREPNDVGGRVRHILIDKNNTNKLIATTAGGGIFTSINNGDTWLRHPQSDTFSSLQGSSMDQSINGDIYFATGEGYMPYGFALIEGGTSLPGDGIWKSTDGGITFSKLQSTTPPVNSVSGDWAYISRVKCHPSNNNIVYAGTNNGLKKSIDGGNTWTVVTQAGGILTSSSIICDLEILPNGNMLVGTTNHLLRSNDGGLTFTRLTGISAGLSRVSS